MQKVIVYGLGHDFDMDKNLIHEKYNVVGYCDRDVSKSAVYGDKQIKREQLKERLQDCDLLLLTVARDRMDIVHDLILNFGIPLSKIWFFRHTGAEDSFPHVGLLPKHIFYGQFYDDAVLWLLFEQLGYKPTHVRYLEIGTNDPILSNNTYFFYASGGRGTLVDPLPTSERFCRLMRPEDRFIQAAVSDNSRADATIYVGVAAQGSSLHEEYAPRKHIEIQVPQIGINDLLETLGYVPELLVVDAEGEDEKILRILNYDKYRPVIIEAEIDKAGNDGGDFYQFMEGKGYIFCVQLGGNAIFIEASKYKSMRMCNDD